MTPRDPREREDIDWLHGPPRWAAVRPRSARELRRWLTKNAQSLDRHGYRGIASAFRAYLAGDAKSLDEAFGLVQKEKRGPKRDPRVLARDVHVFELRNKGYTWSQIAEQTGMDSEEARKLVAALRQETLSSRRPQRDRQTRAIAAYLEFRRKT